MDNDQFIILEKALINVINSDQSIRENSLNVIIDLSKTDNFFNFLMQILFQSSEINAKQQASIQLASLLKVRLRRKEGIDPNMEGFLKHSIIEYLINAPKNNIIFKNIIECIRHFVSKRHETWLELDQYLDQLQLSINLDRLEVLDNIIYYLDPQFVKSKYQFYSNVVLLSIVQSNDFQINTIGISILSSLIYCSESFEGFEHAFEKIFGFLDHYLENPDPNPDHKRFWKSMEKISECGVFPVEFIGKIYDFSMNENIDISLFLMSLNSLEKLIKTFSIDQIFNIIHRIISIGTKYIEIENLLPNECINFIELSFTYFPHAQIYEFLKAAIVSLLEPCPPLAILLFSPIVSSSHEQILKESDFLIEVLKKGFSSQNPLIIESCKSVLESMDDNPELLLMCFDPLFPVVLPLITYPDSNIRLLSFKSLSLLYVDVSGPKHDISTINTLWEYKDSINPENYINYLEVLGCAIVMSEPLNDAQVHEILQFIQSLLAPSEESVIQSSSALYVLGQLISIGEFSEIESILPSTFEIAKFCLNFSNEDVRVYTLLFVMEVFKTYEGAFSDLNEIVWPFINNFLTQKVGSRILEISMEIACRIAIIFQQEDIIQQVLLSLMKQYKSENYQIFLKFAPKITRVTSNDIYKKLLAFVIRICMNEEDTGVIKIGFQSMYKFLKYVKDETKEEALNQSFGLIKSFFDGSMAFLDGRSILNPEIDIDVGIFNLFSDAIGKFLSYKSPYVLEVSRMVVGLTSRAEYQKYVVAIFIDAMENRTLPEEIAIKFIESIQPTINSCSVDDRQNIVYLMIVAIKQYSSLIQLVGNFIPIISEWLSQALADKLDNSALIANIASLFLRLEAITVNVPFAILEPLMEFFPPSDLSEAQGMAESILMMFANANSNKAEAEKVLNPSFRMKTAIALAKFLTEPAKTLRKMNIHRDTYQNIFALFRNLCTAQDIQQAAVGSLANNSKRQAKIIQMIQSE